MKKLLLIIVGLLLFTGCTTAKFGGLQMTDEMPTFEVIGEFKTRVTITKFLGAAGGVTLFNMGRNNSIDPVYDAIQREIGKYGGDAAVNIEIEYGANLVNMFLNSLTGGIYAPSIVKISGTVVKY
ncbi:MAG: hypothetical protein OCD02_01945 [Spirochaetaceae bacterium]